MNHFFSSGDAFLLFGRETANYPAPYAVPVPALPASFSQPRFVQSSGVENDAGAGSIYGLGAHNPQETRRGGQKNKQSVSWAIVPNDELVSVCLPNGGNLPDACLFSGARHDQDGNLEDEPGVANALRFAKCNSLELVLADGPLEARAQFWGLAGQLPPRQAGWLVPKPIPKGVGLRQ